MSELSSDIIVLADFSEPLKELTPAEKQSVVSAKPGGFKIDIPSTSSVSSSTPSKTSTYVKPKETGVKIKTRQEREQTKAPTEVRTNTKFVL